MFFLDGLRKTMKICSQGIRSPGGYLNLGLAELESEVLTSVLNHSFIRELFEAFICYGYKSTSLIPSLQPPYAS
jgi:hypothetical protein